MARSRRRGVEAEGEGEFGPDDVLLGLAREIRAEVERVAASAGDTKALTDALESIPKREKIKVAREVFDHLPPATQWEILEPTSRSRSADGPGLKDVQQRVHDRSR